jgi:methylenetetrahydrofolate dehydrogenase (NADP+)/methenyltetrahydrofolate cyclohydrolase
MKLLEGKGVAEKMLRDLKKKIAKSKTKPGLAVILVGNNKASELYVSLKARAAGEIGMDFWLLKFSAKDTEKDILQAIRELNQDKNIHGIIVQLPLPAKLDTQRIINAIDLKKDADGFSSVNPVFPQAIVKLIEASGENVIGRKAVVIANSDKFGKVMTAALKIKKIKAEYVLISNIKSQISNIKEADIIVTAVGKSKFIKGTMIKKGAIVIDGGITKRGKKVLGDVDFQSVKKIAGFLSPVPGGVGPVTVACLLNNVFEFCRQKR